MNRLLNIIICSSAFLMAACSSQSPAKIEYRNDAPSVDEVQEPLPAATPAVEGEYQPPSEVSEESLVETDVKAEQVYKVSDKVGPEATVTKVEEPKSEIAATDSSEKTYTVLKGETLFSVSRKFGVPILPIIAANDLKQPYILTEGQKIKIPAGKYHVVDKGETLYSISREHGVDMSGIVKLNNMQMPYNVVEGQSIQIPFSNDLPKQEVKEELAVTENIVSEPQQQTQEQRAVYKEGGPASMRRNTGGILGEIRTTKTGEVVSLTSVPASPAAEQPVAEETPVAEKAPEVKPEVKDDGKFMWPATGKIVKKFGQQGSEYNDGINIAASAGTAVSAASSGRVVYTGNSLKSYGNLVIVKHDNGLLSAYAHMNDVSVKKDDKVTKGQTIGTVGSTGKVTSPQLYFAIREGKDAKNPLKYLPKQ